jgi:hypothetical protein
MKYISHLWILLIYFLLSFSICNGKNNYASFNYTIYSNSQDSVINIEDKFEIFEKKIIPKGVAIDSVFIYTGEIYQCIVRKITATNILISQYDDDKILYSISRNDVNMIVYKNGTREIFSNFPKQKNVKDWHNVKITSDPLEVLGFEKIETIIADASSSLNSSLTSKDLENIALVKIRKKAALLYADFVLITDRQFTKGYGEVPTFTIKGVAYKVKK